MFSPVFFVIFQLVVIIFEKKSKFDLHFRNLKINLTFSQIWTHFILFFNHLVKKAVRYRLHAGETVEHPQAYFLYYIISCAFSVTALCIFRVGTVIVKLQVTMPALQLV